MTENEKDCLYKLADEAGIHITECLQLIKPFNHTDVEVSLIVTKDLINQIKGLLKV